MRRLWLPPKHPLLNQEIVTLADVARQPYIQLLIDDAETTTSAYWRAHNLQFNIVVRTNPSKPCAALSPSARRHHPLRHDVPAVVAGRRPHRGARGRRQYPDDEHRPCWSRAHELGAECAPSSSSAASNTTAAASRSAVTCRSSVNRRRATGDRLAWHIACKSVATPPGGVTRDVRASVHEGSSPGCRRSRRGFSRLGAGAYGWKVGPTHVDLSMPSPQPVAATISAEPQNITVDLKRSAMIVVDMQNDFCAPGGWVD